MNRYLLDTNVVSSFIRERGASPALRRAAAVGLDHICTSVIVAAEIRFGVAKKQSPRLAAEAERVLGGLDILPFAPPADEAYAGIRADLARRGLTIGANDLLIAAHCVALGLTLVTHNTREFERVSGLAIEDWLTN